MSLNVPLLQDSFALVAEAEPELAKHFYGHLFTDYPQVKPLFGSHSMTEQGKMLTEMLASVIGHLEDEQWLVSNLKALGVRHLDYGVTEEMYPMVGASLLKTLAQVAGDKWSDELHSAWSDALGAISALMLDVG